MSMIFAALVGLLCLSAGWYLGYFHGRFVQARDDGDLVRQAKPKCSSISGRER